MKEKELNHLIKACDAQLVDVPYESKEFPDICEEILKDSAFMPSLNDLSKPYMWQSSYQHYKMTEFSQLPLTLHAWENFHLDLYVWEKSRTGIHDHHFQGAFKVIEGNYLQTSFTFTQENMLYPDIYKGKILSHGNEDIAVGNVKKITPEGKFIHSVSHNQEVNITLCLRTKNLAENLYEYLFPDLKVLVKSIDEKTLNKLNRSLIERKDLDLTISEIDLLRFADQKIKDPEQFSNWWDFVISQRGDEKLIELRNALKKTKLLLN